MLRPWSEEPPIHPVHPIYAWERLPEYMDIQKFARHLGRIFASVPPWKRRAIEKRTTRAAAHIAMTICSLNLEGDGAAEVREHAQANLQPRALAGIEELRRELIAMREAKLGSQWDIEEGLGLLEGVERRLRETVPSDAFNPRAAVAAPPRSRRHRRRD